MQKIGNIAKPRDLPPPSDGAEARFVENWISDWPEEERAQWKDFRAAEKKIKSSHAVTKPV